MALEDSIQNDNPRGYKPLELEYRDNHLWMADGTLFQPDFEVGSERHQIDLFIEYERSFGRGRAFEATHKPRVGNIDPRIAKEFYGSIENYHSIPRDWDKIRFRIAEIVKSGTPEEARELIKKIREFRRKYPTLYSDAPDHQGPGHIY